jgi:hypothetical protein
MARSIIELPSDLDGDYEVYLNGVQQAYVDFDVDERVLVFNQPVAGELAAMTGATTHAMEVVSIPSTAYAGIVVSTFGDYIDAILQEANRLRALAAHPQPQP